MKIAIVVPGHTVEKGSNGWASTDIYQEVTFPKPGRTFPFERTGVYNPGLEPNSPTAYLAGSRQVVRAAVTAYRELFQKENSVSFVITAGRPQYLQNAAVDEPEITEGSVMAREIRAALGTDVSISLHEDGLVTKDDVRVILDAAASHDAALVVAMGFRLPRMEVLMQEVVREVPGLAEASSRVRMLAAEALVVGPPRVIEFTLSDAYQRTMENERFAIRQALETGAAATTSGKT